MKMFVYGILKKDFRGNTLMKSSKFLGEAEVPGHIYSVGSFPGAVFLFPKFLPVGSFDEQTQATEERVTLDSWSESLERIRGEVYEITHPELLRALDLMEGFHGRGKRNLYDRVVVETNDGDRVWAYAFQDISRLSPERLVIPDENGVASWK